MRAGRRLGPYPSTSSWGPIPPRRRPALSPWRQMLAAFNWWEGPPIDPTNRPHPIEPTRWWRFWAAFWAILQGLFWLWFLLQADAAWFGE